MSVVEQPPAEAPILGNSDACRLCGAPTAEAFSGRVLRRHEVAFQQCSGCGSLQCQAPYWIDEAYSSAIAVTDTGAAIRNAVCQAAIVSIARILGITGTFLDFGGGTGLLCRMLRDIGFDAYVFDKYADPVYARGFILDPRQVAAGKLGLLSAVEVFEHCIHPAADLQPLFATRPTVLFATTTTYHGQGVDWWYLGMETGQHVFFYSEDGLRILAQSHGYQHYGLGIFHIFTRAPIAAWRRALLRTALSRPGLRLVRLALTATQRGRHADKDCADMSRALAAQTSHGKHESYEQRRSGH